MIPKYWEINSKLIIEERILEQSEARVLKKVFFSKTRAFTPSKYKSRPSLSQIKCLILEFNFDFYNGQPLTDTNVMCKFYQDQTFCSWFIAQSDFHIILYLTLTLWPWLCANLNKVSISILWLIIWSRSDRPFVIYT